MHDDTQVARIFLLGKALSEGQFPVRWISELGYGYGYPLFNFYAPLPYYFGGLLTLLGFDALVATKIVMGLGIIVAGLGMYFFVQKMLSWQAALISSLLYIYAPYHAVELFVRGSVGELWAYGLLPFMCLGFWEIFHTGRIKWVVFSALFLALIILSHNIIGVLTFLGIMLGVGSYTIVLYLHRKKITTCYLLLATLLLSLGLSAFFWLPALVEVSLTKALRLATEVNFQDHFVYLDQLWNSPWGFAGSGPGRMDGMSFKIGKLHILLGFLGMVSWYWEKKQRLFLALVSSTVFVSIFMMVPSSQLVWDAFPFLWFIQFPWRFLVFTLFGVSILGGYATELFPKKYYSLFFLGLICILILFLNAKLFIPQTVFPYHANDYTSIEKLRWDTSQISDEYLPRDFPIPQKNSEIPHELVVHSNDIIVRALVEKSNRIVLTVDSFKKQMLTVNRAYFPGWIAFLDGSAIPIVALDGKMSVEIEKGSQTIQFSFSNTISRIIGNLISLFGIGVGAGLLFYEKRTSFI